MRQINHICPICGFANGGGDYCNCPGKWDEIHRRVETGGQNRAERRKEARKARRK